MTRNSIFFLVTTIFLFSIANAKFHLKNGTTPLDKEKIIGGYEVDIKHYPFQVGLILIGLGQDLMCGGSLITNRHVLTSAHCFMDNKNPRDWRVRSGSTFGNKGGVLSRVSRIIRHEHFKYIPVPEFDANDIAIVVLTTPLKLDHTTQKVPLISRNLQKGEEVYVSGWGYESMLGKGESGTLKALRLRVDDSCEYWHLPEKKICARTGIESGTCFGDSGGPLVSRGQLAGIITGTPSDVCADPDEPYIFTSVLHHKDWLKKHVKILQ